MRLIGIHRRFGVRRPAWSRGGRRRRPDASRPARSSGWSGESGCGKTTLARIAVGLDHPDEGEVLLDGRPLTDRRGAIALADRRRVQLVFQDAHASFNPRRTIGRALATAAASARPPARGRARPGRRAARAGGPRPGDDATGCRTRCRAASSSAPRSPERSRSTRRSSSATSRSRRWTCRSAPRS